jgi:hypothetical protein
MTIDNGLGPGTELHQMYLRFAGPLALISRARFSADAPARDAVWLKRYRNFLLGAGRRLGQGGSAALPDPLPNGNGHSALKQNLQPLLIRLMGIEQDAKARGDIERQAFIFPAVRDFDVRMLPGEFPPAIVFTEGTLDLIRFYAGAVAVCRALNAAALPQILEFEQRESGNLPPAVVLEWMTFDPQARQSVIEWLAKLAVSPKGLQARLFGRPGVDGSSVLATAILDIALDLVARYLHQPFALPHLSESAAAVTDTDYVATLIVAYMALHEVAHVALCHGREASYAGFLRSHLAAMGIGSTLGEPSPNPFVDARLDDGRKARFFVGDHTPVDEVQADLTALRYVGDRFRPSILSAATVWLAALEDAFVGQEGRADCLSELGTATPYPSFILRLRTLNEAYGSAERRWAIGPVLDAIEKRGTTYRDARGIDLRDHAQRDRDLQLFRTLTAVAETRVSLL